MQADEDTVQNNQCENSNNSLNAQVVTPEIPNDKKRSAELTEDKDEVVDALLSLSNSIPRDLSQDGLDNSTILPIGQAPIDAAPVPIKLSAEDVNQEMFRLKLTPNAVVAKQANATPSCTGKGNTITINNQRRKRVEFSSENKFLFKILCYLYYLELGKSFPFQLFPALIL